MEDDLSIFRLRTWTRYVKLGGVRFLRFFNTSLRCRYMTEDDLSIFRVRILTRHDKLGGVHFLRFSDMCLRFSVMVDQSLLPYLTEEDLSSGGCSHYLTQNLVNLMYTI